MAINFPDSPADQDTYVDGNGVTWTYTLADDSWTAETNLTVDVVSNVATQTILGRNTAGSGDSEELAPATARTVMGVDPSYAQASAGEITAGTETAIRKHSPADIVSYISQHESATPTVPVQTVAVPVWTFSTSTTNADPGDGFIRFDNATPASVTGLYAANLDKDGIEALGILEGIGQRLLIKQVDNAAKFLLVQVTDHLDGGDNTWTDLTVKVEDSGTLPDNNSDVSIAVLTPSMLDWCDIVYRFDTSTVDADPGQRELRYNGTDLSATGILYVDTHAAGLDGNAEQAESVRGIGPNDSLEIFHYRNGHRRFYTYQVESIEAPTGYFKIWVQIWDSHVAGGESLTAAPAAGDPIGIKVRKNARSGGLSQQAGNVSGTVTLYTGDYTWYEMTNNGAITFSWNRLNATGEGNASVSGLLKIINPNNAAITWNGEWGSTGAPDMSDITSTGYILVGYVWETGDANPELKEISRKLS